MSAKDGGSLLPDGEEYEDTEPDWVATREILAESRGETKRFLWFALLPVALLVITAGAIFFTSGDSETSTEGDAAGPALQSESTDLASDAEGSADAAADDGSDAETSTDADGTDASNTGAGAEDGDAASDQQDTDTLTVLPTPPTDAPYVNATLNNNAFVLSGTVPSEELKQLLEGRAEVAYAPFFTSELEVDESVGDAAWLAAAPEVVGLLPMITDGTIRLQDDAITVAGRSPNPEYAANFQGALGLITGLPVTDGGIEITDLVPPRFVASVTEGKVLLEGEIPSEAIGETFFLGAAAIYGPDNVTSTMTVDDGTYTSFWMYTMPGIFQLFQPFPAYEIQVIDGITSGKMQGGVLFDLNSSEISSDAAQVLGIGVALLVRDRSLDMKVIGHTDSRGPRDLNQELSLQRAQSVIDFLLENGVPAERLSAEGKGPDEPIADNETDEGRALNRRVEFLFD